MKKLAYSLLFLIITMMAIRSESVAGRLDVEKKKTIEKSYEVKSNVTLDIKNSFGKVHVNTWGKNLITVKVEVIVRRRTESRALDLLDRIDIDITESGSQIKFETDFNGGINNKNSESFEINYDITMPKSNPLRIKNSFGDTYIADIDGDVNLKLSYGDVRLDNMNGDSNIKISFCDGTVKSIAKGTLELKYSDLSVDRMGMVKLEQSFSDLEIESAGTIDLTAKYGDLDIGTVQGIKGYIGFTDVRIDRLDLELDVEASYAGDFTVDEIGKNFTKIIIDGKFGDYDLGFEQGASGTLEVELKHCDLRYSRLDIDFHYQVKEDFRSEYRGEIGNGIGGKVKIYSSYGDVRLQ